MNLPDINLTDLNAKLKYFSSLPIVETKPDDDGEGYTIRKITDELFLKVHTYEDSYGESSILGVEFVKSIESTVTNYETF